MNASALALIELGRLLARLEYRFVTVTPETHRRLLARTRPMGQQSGQQRARDLRDVFGWSLPFEPSVVPANVVELLRSADALDVTSEGLLRSRVRFSTLDERVFVHSAFPTQDRDAVFFGPDTYRFCQLLKRWAPPAKRAVDVGAGSGAGGLCIADRAQQVVLADINTRALSYAFVNVGIGAGHNDSCFAASIELLASDVLAGVPGELDLVVANPPYLRDAQARTYRDGGGDYGEALGVRIVREAFERLSRHGTLVLYTGSAIVDGQDTFLRAVTPILNTRDAQWSYEELDPDVFGEELAQPAYRDVERIAAVGLRATVR